MNYYTRKVIDIVKHIIDHGSKTYFQSDYIQSINWSLFHLDHVLTLEINKYRQEPKVHLKLQLKRNDDVINEIYFSSKDFNLTDLEIASMSFLRDIKSSRRFSYFNLPEIPLRCEL